MNRGRLFVLLGVAWLAAGAVCLAKSNSAVVSIPFGLAGLFFVGWSIVRAAWDADWGRSASALEREQSAFERKRVNMLQLGIIGFGGMAGEHHRELKGYDRVSVKGIYDIDPAREADAAREGLVVYESREALLEDPAIDIVLVATTNEVHKEICIDALEHGKHVICEKPVTMDAAELEEIIAVAKRTGKVFTVNQNRRTNCDFVLMRRQVEAGLLGEVYQLESAVEGSRGMPDGWRNIKSLGGGMLLDWGVHLIDQLMYMYADKKVTSVYCRMESVHYPEIDDNFELVMTFQDGPTGCVRVGTNDFITHPRWHVMGKNGTLEIADWDCNGKVIRSLYDEKAWANEIVMTKAGPTKTMAPRNAASVETIDLHYPEDVRDNLLVVYDGLVDAISGTGELWVKPEEALRVMRVIDAAFQSAENNEVVKTDI